MSFLKQMLGLEGSSQTGNSTSTSNSTTKTTLDPAIQSMIFGQNGSGGLLSRYQSYLDQPQSSGLLNYNGATNNYLSNYGAGALQQLQGAATDAMTGRGADLASIPAYAQGNMVQAPSQNNMDLSGSYDRFINGQPGANPYLDQSINGAIAQNRLGFQQLQSDATDNLMKNVLPSIRSNSVLAGQYGGSRQGVAEGNAIGDFGKAMSSAANQFGQNATNAAVNAKAGAYDTDSNRALAAAQGLGAQQYGVAQQNAATKNAAEFMNVGNSVDVSKFNAGTSNQVNAQNKGLGLAGAGLLGNVMNNAYNTATNGDNYAVNRAQQVNGLLYPYLNANSTTTTNGTNTTPIYENRGQSFLSTVGNLASLFG